MRLMLLAVVLCGLTGCGESAEASSSVPEPEAPEAPTERATPVERKRRYVAAEPATPPPPPPPPPVKPSPTATARSTSSAATKSQPSEEELARQAARAALAKEESERRAMAAKVATNIVARGYSYDRAALKRLQARTGLAPDGIYGGGSAGMLRYYLQPKPPPKPLFRPTAEVTYVPR